MMDFNLHEPAKDKAALNALIVEDSPDSAILLKYRLSEEGLNVKIASSGEEALKSVSVQKPDMIYLDLTLPDMDGAEVARKIHEVLDNPPAIVILSGHERSRVEEELNGLAVFDIFQKPVSTSDLRKSLAEFRKTLGI